MPTTAARRRAFTGLLALYGAAALAFLCWAGYRAARAWDNRVQLVVEQPNDRETVWNKMPPYAGDPVVGFRARRNMTARMTMGAIGSDEPMRIERRANNLGLIRQEDVHELAKGRRILLVGDSHLMGVVR